MTSGNAVARLRYMAIPSPLGALYAVFGDGGLCGLRFARNASERAFVASLPEPVLRVEPADDEAAAQLADELARYFAGEPDPFETKLDLRSGTAFQRRVWRVLRSIPFGSTVSYGDVARRIGSPHAARAVGQAVGANPVSIIVPCHRVIRASGALGGFGGGLPIKRWLLRHEGGLV